jgi:hypothetical protein
MMGVWLKSYQPVGQVSALPGELGNPSDGPAAAELKANS